MDTEFTSLKTEGYKPFLEGSNLRYYYENNLCTVEQIKVGAAEELHECRGIVYAGANLDGDSCKTKVARVFLKKTRVTLTVALPVGNEQHRVVV